MKRLSRTEITTLSLRGVRIQASEFTRAKTVGVLADAGAASLFVGGSPP